MIKLIYTPCPTFEVAKTLGRSLIEKKMAACVNILPGVTSLYYWDNSVVTDSEVILLIKTSSTQVKTVEAELLAHHPYETPAVLVLNIENVNEGFLSWVKGQLNLATSNI